MSRSASDAVVSLRVAFCRIAWTRSRRPSTSLWLCSGSVVPLAARSGWMFIVTVNDPSPVSLTVRFFFPL